MSIRRDGAEHSPSMGDGALRADRLRLAGQPVGELFRSSIPLNPAAPAQQSRADRMEGVSQCARGLTRCDSCRRSSSAQPPPLQGGCLQGVFTREPSQGLEPRTPSLPFTFPRRNRRVRMTPQAPQNQGIRPHERPRRFPRGDAPARVGVRTLCAHRWPVWSGWKRRSLRCRRRCASRPPRSAPVVSRHCPTEFTRRSSPKRYGDELARYAESSCLERVEILVDPTALAGHTRQLEDLRGPHRRGGCAGCVRHLRGEVLSGLLSVWGDGPRTEPAAECGLRRFSGVLCLAWGGRTATQLRSASEPRILRTVDLAVRQATAWRPEGSEEESGPSGSKVLWRAPYTRRRASV
jgi:hypothetical protein